MIRIPGGTFRMGSDRHYREEAPVRHVAVDPFWMDPCTVTNAQFAAFVAATFYVTVAERKLNAVDYPGARPELLVPGALVFHMTDGPVDTGDVSNWWSYVPGACWRHPEGLHTGIAERSKHPVVHVSWNDAIAFTAWAGGRLPTEAEWELAAHGGLAEARFPWGDREPDDDAFQPCNIWQGEFPDHNSCADGHAGTAPVDAFTPNGFGLFNMVGNAWEWCGDAFRIRSLARAAQKRNEAAHAAGERLLKGGSYLCHRSYCYRYRIAARTGVSPDSSIGHVGFRVAFDE